MNKYNALAAIQRAVLVTEAIGATDSANPAIPGLRSLAWYAQYADMTAGFSDAAAATTYALQGEYDTAPTMVATKLFKTIEIVVNENTFKAEPIGGKNTGAFKVSARLFVAGTLAEVRGFANEAKFNRYVFVVQLANGQRMLLGDAIRGRYATVQPMFDSLKDEDGGVIGYEFMVEAVQNQIIELKSTVTIPVS